MALMSPGWFSPQTSRQPRSSLFWGRPFCCSEWLQWVWQKNGDSTAEHGDMRGIYNITCTTNSIVLDLYKKWDTPQSKAL